MLYRSSSRDKTQQPVLQVSDYYWNIRELEHSTYLRDILVLKIASSCLLLFHPTVSEKYLRIATVPWQANPKYISLSSKSCWRIWKKTCDCQPAVMFCWECSFFPFFSTSQLFSMHRLTCCNFVCFRSWAKYTSCPILHDRMDCSATHLYFTLLMCLAPI